MNYITEHVRDKTIQRRRTATTNQDKKTVDKSVGKIGSLPTHVIFMFHFIYLGVYSSMNMNKKYDQTTTNKLVAE